MCEILSSKIFIFFLLRKNSSKNLLIARIGLPFLLVVFYFKSFLTQLSIQKEKNTRNLTRKTKFDKDHHTSIYLSIHKKYISVQPQEVNRAIPIPKNNKSLERRKTFFNNRLSVTQIGQIESELVPDMVNSKSLFLSY